jgi:hypothetical protein
MPALSGAFRKRVLGLFLIGLGVLALSAPLHHLRFDKEEARRLIMGSAYQYKGDLLSPTVTMPQQAFADEHGTPRRSASSICCLAT